VFLFYKGGVFLMMCWSREILDGLREVGFRTNLGIDGTGFGLLAWSKAGGYYLGASSHIFVV
jgi:hypothetical protein